MKWGLTYLNLKHNKFNLIYATAIVTRASSDVGSEPAIILHADATKHLQHLKHQHIPGRLAAIITNGLTGCLVLIVCSIIAGTIAPAI